ncbi:ankyrin repeat and LEM domain-containing protein 2 [Anoplophora glabripennis]|uniref:ankyrin repeat and LEM domain-containing protein 2 n=1 Tax=Anoplophora glabripennis TaxID=217634 RepID=UPI000873C93E|nr:ankyrin repeat and LEM domain-containing protein 2 [Anoplophora glabripennis]
MDSPTSNNLNNLKETSSSGTLYYGLYTPNDNKDFLPTSPNVFEDKFEALKVAKKNKKSRFKAFQFYHEAVEFALNGSEFPNNNTTVTGHLLPKIQLDSAQSIGEKASPFKGPKPQELVELRKAIEGGHYKVVMDTIWQNPRYLVSSGDTPSILQEGPRYNALHVAAKAKNAEITELILTTVSNTDFIKLLYGDDNQQNAEARTAILLDLYLNTPNKGLNETPLHFASKYGAVDVLEILVSYPQCDKTLKNKFQKTAQQIICERAEGDNLSGVRKKIELLLQDSYYVPVLRVEDNSLPPTIGEPFSPTSPPVLNINPLSSRLEIHAYAGPMNKKGAQEFRRVWKTPPRSLNSSSSNSRKLNDLHSVSSLRFKDLEKGLERIGKKLANKYEVNWKEYWPFLDSFVDIASDEGLRLLEDFLSNHDVALSKSYMEYIKNDSPELSKSDPLSPISNLCIAFSACRLNDSQRSPNLDLNSDSNRDSIIYIDKACQVFANRISNDILYILCSEENIIQVLETEMRQLELLITSYMDDNRFSSINFQKIHSRLGTLIGQKLYNNIKEEVRVFLCGKIENILDNLTKSVDCFSSDDEGHSLKEISENRKPTIYKKQLICLIHHILNVLCQSYEIRQIGIDDDCIKDWEIAEACTCVYHRRSKKNNLSRSSSFKNNLFGRNDVEGIPRKLCFDDEDEEHGKNGISIPMKQVEPEDSDDADQFYTPPSSPSLLESEESDDEFNDSELPKYEIFIEGDCPTKLDCDVYNALSYSECVLDKDKYPTVYKWHHNISLYPISERESWACLKDITKAKSPHPNRTTSSSYCVDSPRTSTPSKSWLRITGANSPKAVFKSYSMQV